MNAVDNLKDRESRLTLSCRGGELPSRLRQMVD